MGILEILNSASSNCVYAVKGENEGCASPTSLKAWPLAQTDCFLQRTENTQFITSVPVMSCSEGDRAQRSGRVMKHVPPTDAGFLQVAETANAPYVQTVQTSNEMMKVTPTP